MNYWYFGKTWQSGGLTNQSAELESTQSKLLDDSQDVLALRMPFWVSTAADVAKVDRELIASRLEHIAALLLGVSSLEASGASGLDQIKRNMADVEAALESGGFRVGENGQVWRHTFIKGLDLPSWFSQAAASVRAVAEQLKMLDESCAASLDEIAKSAADTERREHAVDHLNSMRLAALPGALDGVDWNFDWDYDDMLPIPWELSGLGEKMYLAMARGDVQWALKEHGRLPRWLQDYLLDGKMPSPTEVVAFHGYSRVNRHDWLGDKVWDAMNKHLGKGEWDISAKDMRTFFEDGQGRLPGEPIDSSRSAVPSNVAELMDEMHKIYDKSTINDGAIEVRVHEVDGVPYFTAVVPGTTTGMEGLQGWNESGVGTDWTANMHAKGFGTSAVTESTIAAIDAAVREYEQQTGKTVDRPNITLAGHSQGGMNAANIAADRSFAARYNVEYVVAAGSPVSDIEVGPNTKVINFVNEHDGTAGLAGGTDPALKIIKEAEGNKFSRFIPENVGSYTPQSNYHQVTFKDHDYPQHEIRKTLSGWADSHYQNVYHDRMAAALEEGSANPEVQRYNAEMQNYFSGDGKDHVYRYQTGRVK